MRSLTFSAKPVDGTQLRAELVAAGVPLPQFTVVRQGDSLVILVDVEPGVTTHDAAVTAVVQAHTPPADLTPAQFKRRVAREVVREFKEAFGAAIRAFALETIDALREERQRYNALRADVIAGRTGAQVTATSLPVPTVQQAVDAIYARIDAIIAD